MSKTTRKIRKILLWLIAVFIVFVLIAGGIIFFWVQDYLNNNLTDYVSNKTDGLYRLNFEKIELNFGKQGFNINGLILEPDQLKAEELHRKNPDKLIYTLTTPELKIEHLNMLRLLKHKKLSIKKISIVQPGFSVAGSNNLNTDSTRLFDQTLHEFRIVFYKYLKEINIKEIDFIDAKYQFYKLIGDSTGISKANRISVEIDQLHIDSTLLERNQRPFEAKDIIIRMNNFRYEMGDSLHIMDIDSLEYSFTKSELNAFQVKLFPETINPSKNLYNLSVPRFILRSKSITDIYTTDSMRIQYLELNEPKITFSRKEVVKQIEIEDIDNFNLYELVENDLDLVKIDSFFLKNASLKILRQNIDTSYQQSYNDIDIQLNKFSLDAVSNKNPNKLFYSDDLEMAVNGYELKLDDHIHRFKAGKIFVSTFENNISVSEVLIAPINSKSKAPTIINIGCKQIALNGVNLKKVYHSRILPVTNIEIEHPTVHLDYHTEMIKKKGRNQAGLLFELVNAYLNGVYSKIIVIQDGSLKISNLRHGRQRGFFETEFNFNLTDFTLDSESARNTEQVFYATNFDLAFSNYRMKLVDNLHQLRVKNIHASSLESAVRIDSLHLLPAQKNVTVETMKEFNRSELYNIFVPKITLYNSKIHDALFWNNLSISDFKIEDPKIFFENFASLKAGKKKKEFSELYQLIVDYVDDISIRNVIVPDGSITWVNHSKKGKTTSLENRFSIELNNFKLNKDELGKKRILFSDHLNFSLKDQLFELSDKIHFLQAKQIDFSTSKSLIVFKDALLYPDITSTEYMNKPTTFQVTLPKLEFRGVDIVPAYFSGNIDVKEFVATNPKFEIYSQEGKTKPFDFKNIEIPLPPKINSLSVDNLSLSNGEVIAYQTKGTGITQTSSFKLALKAEKIKLHEKHNSKETELLIDDIIARVNNFQLILKDKSHELTTTEFVYHKKGENININNFKVQPSVFAPPDDKFNIVVPSVQLNGFDTKSAYESNKYHFKNIVVSNPDIKINISSKKEKKEVKTIQEFDLYPYLEPYLNELKIGTLTLNNANVSLKGLKHNLEHDSIDIRINEIAIDGKIKKSQLLNSESVELTTSDIRKSKPQSNYELTIDKLKFNSLGNSIRLENLKVKPKLSKQKFARNAGVQVDIFDGSFEYLILNNIDIDKWLDQKTLDADYLVIGPSNIDIFRNKRYLFDKNQKPPWPQDILKSLKIPFVIDSVSILPASIKYSELLETTDEPATINFTDLKVNFGKISNILEYIEKRPLLWVDASAKINGESLLDAKFSFKLNDSKYLHTVKGSLQPLDMTMLNDLIEKAAFVTVEEGDLNRFDFELEVDNEKATGKLFFGYDNLKVALIEFEDGKINKVGLASFMANSLVINAKNPRGKTFEPETIDYPRDPSRSVINYWWKALFSGAKKALGIKDKKQ